jgi:hypothetical protein
MIRVVWWDLDNRGFLPPTVQDVEINLIRDLPLDPETLAGIDVLIAAAEEIGGEGVLQSLLRLLSFPARPPVLLRTSPEPDNTRFLKDLLVEDLAWTSEPEEEVIARGARLARQTKRRRLADHFLRSISDCSTVDKALRRVFLGKSPVSRVRDLARDCFVSQRTLERKWNESRPEGHPIGLKELLDWALLLRAWELHRLSMFPHEIARVLGVNDRTLGRLANRLAGLTCLGFLSLQSDQLEQLVDQELLGRNQKESRSA